MKKKKLAVLTWGMIREFEYAHKTWTFLNDIEYDIFFSVWDKSYEINGELNNSIIEDVTEEMILQYFPNAITNIESETNVNFQTNMKRVEYHWKKLFNLLEKSEYEYEYVLLLRPDSYIEEHEFSKYINNINDEHLHGLSIIMHHPSPSYHFVQDCLFVGKTKPMKDIFLSFNPPDLHTHYINYHLAKHFVHNDMYVQFIPLNILNHLVMRIVHRDFLNLNFEQLEKIGIEWWNLKHKM
jgi:hypothetical protein